MREAMERLVRYHRLVCDGAELSLSVSEGTAQLSLHPSGFAGGFAAPLGRGARLDASDVGAPCHAATDALLSLIVRVCRLVTNRNFTLELVRCRRPTPTVLWRYQQVYRCPIDFGANDDALLFDARALDAPLVMANPELARRNDDAARAYLERMEHEGIVTLVRGKLAHRLADKPSAQCIARELGMSQRSMQRRLNEAGTSYEALLGTLRKEQACAQLRDGHKNVAELAFALGFEDASAFARAFRRWTGLSPSAYRAEPGPAL
jgi:AraC-like DNA-binding protein